jgi:hypothetical protein
MIDVAYPLFGGLLLLVSITSSCLSRRVSHMADRIAVLENQRIVVQPVAPPHPQHVAIYMPPQPSAPPSLPTNMYYDGRVRTAVI